MDALQSDIIEEIELLIQKDRLILPTLPEIALQARDAALDPNISARELAEVVSNDPAMTARLIRVANSPLVRAQRQIDDLGQAIARMGMSMACNIISALAMRQMFQASHPRVDTLMREIWGRSTEVAGIAAVLCRHYTPLKPDQAMLAGLLYQVGALPVFSYIEEHDALLSSDALDDIVAALHPRLGALILSHWEFPHELIQVPMDYTQLQRQVPVADYVDLVTVAHLESLYGSHPENGPAVETVGAYARIGLQPTQTGDAELRQEMKSTGQALQS